MSAGTTSKGITVKELLELPYESGVIAPKGTITDWDGANSDDNGKAYAGAVLSKKASYNSGNSLIESHVAVFSSTDFIYNDFAGYNIDNELLTRLVTERVSGATNKKMSFAPKHIKKETKSEE